MPRRPDGPDGAGALGGIGDRCRKADSNSARLMPYGATDDHVPPVDGERNVTAIVGGAVQPGQHACSSIAELLSRASFRASAGLRYGCPAIAGHVGHDVELDRDALGHAVGGV